MKATTFVLAGWLALVLLGSALGPSPSTHQNVSHRDLLALRPQELRWQEDRKRLEAE